MGIVQPFAIREARVLLDLQHRTFALAQFCRGFKRISAIFNAVEVETKKYKPRREVQRSPIIPLT